MDTLTQGPATPGAAPDRRPDTPETPPVAPAGLRTGQTAAMRDVLTGGHDTAGRMLMDGVAPAATGVAPGPRPAAPATHRGVPPRRDGAAGGWPAGSVEGVSWPQAAVEDAGAAAPAGAAAGAPPRAVPRLMLRSLAVAALVFMVPVVAVAFAASYTTLETFARGHGFASWLVPYWPVAVDGAILGLLALDLYKTARRHPWWVLRFAAHGMTAVTVLLNSRGTGHSLSTDPYGALAHAAMPVLFVIGVEGVRRLLVFACRLQDGTGADRIPLHRWALDPAGSARMYRRMRLAGVPSYQEMIHREMNLRGYEIWLRQELGGSLAKATDEQRLPMTMAPHGYTVQQAQALPAKWRQEAAERQRAQAERDRVEAEQAAERAKQDRIKALHDEAEVEQARHLVAADTDTAAAQAEAKRAEAQGRAEAAKVRAEQARTQAERVAVMEAQAQETAAAAAARRKAAEDTRNAEEQEAEAARLAKQAALDARDAQTIARDAERLAKEQQELEAARVHSARQAADEVEQEQASRVRAAKFEVRARQLEDLARLQPRERNARRVARMLMAGPVTLAQIEADLGVARSTASELRQEAERLLADGYPETELHQQMDQALDLTA